MERKQQIDYLKIPEEPATNIKKRFKLYLVLLLVGIGLVIFGFSTNIDLLSPVIAAFGTFLFFISILMFCIELF